MYIFDKHVLMIGIEPIELAIDSIQWEKFSYFNISDQNKKLCFT